MDLSGFFKTFQEGLNIEVEELVLLVNLFVFGSEVCLLHDMHCDVVPHSIDGDIQKIGASFVHRIHIDPLLHQEELHQLKVILMSSPHDWSVAI